MRKTALPKAVVIGWPIDHSRSPLIHNFWLAQQGLAGEYAALAVKPEEAETFFSNFKTSGLIGMNVTIPYKKTVMPYLDSLDRAAKAIGAVNTVWLVDGKMHGANSDWIGFLDNLDQENKIWDEKKSHALVFGAGGAARGIVFALLQRGFKKITVANRTLSTALDLVRDFGDSLHAISLEEAEQAVETANFIVNTTSLGMGNNPPLPLTFEALPPDCLVSDIVYSPLETPLLKLAKSKNNPTIDGLGMLLHQAKMGSKQWFGGNPQVTSELRNLVLRDMGL